MTTTTNPGTGPHFATSLLTTTLPIADADRHAGTQLRYEGGTLVLTEREPGTRATWLARRWDGATVTVHAARP